MKKKILIVSCNNLDRGGIQSVIMNAVRSLHQIYTFDIITFDNKKTFYDKEFESFGGKIFRYGAFDGKTSFHKRLDFYVRGPYLYKAAKRVLKNNGPYAAIHCHNLYESAYFLSAAQKYGVPVRIVHAHTAFKNNYDNFIARHYANRLKKRMLSLATNLVGCSDLANQTAYQTKNATVLRCMLDQTFAAAAPKPLKETEPHLIQVGLYCENKNQLFTLEVFKRLLKKYPGAALTFVGRAPTDELMAYFKKLKQQAEVLSKNIEFLPADTNLAAAYSKAHYLIFPSYAEGFGIVAVEAQAVGRRCFVSDSVTNDVDCGGCTFLPLSAGAQEWADIIAKDFEKTGGAHGNYDCRRFLQEEVAKQYVDLYEGRQM